MADASFDPGNPYGTQRQAPRLRVWVVALPLLLGLAGGAHLLMKNKEDIAATVEETTSVWRPRWQPETYASTPPVVTPEEHDQTQEMLRALMAKLDAQQKEIAELRKRPAATTGGGKPKRREHTPMQFIEHKPEKRDVAAKDLHWLAAGTWVACTVEPHINSDVPGYFTVKTRAPVYDTKTGQHLLIKQNQSIVAKDESADLLFGNTRIPTFALTLAHPDGSSTDLGSMPITDQLGTNGLTGKISNHIWRLVWTSIFIGGLRGGQQAIQAGVTPGDPTGSVASGVTGQISQTGQSRLGRAQDTRPTIEVESGSPCQILLTKSIQLPEISR